MTHFVSICTPTFNRRHFIETLVFVIKHQTYPHCLMEWLIADDGTDPIEDLIKNITFIKVNYFRLESQQSLGFKRNFLNKKATGDIIVYFDDDDYYPPNRISNGIKLLNENPSYKIAGSSMMYIYYHHTNEIYSCGPYGENHATAATFIFKKELLDETHFDNYSLISEEKYFLKNYTIPMIQLESLNTILVIAHEQNTFDKKKLLINPDNFKIIKTDLKLNHFISNTLVGINLIKFYQTDLHICLEKYKLGTIDKKKDISNFITEIENTRQKKKDNLEIYKKNTTSDEKTNKNYEEKLKQKSILIQKLLLKVKSLKEEINLLKIL